MVMGLFLVQSFCSSGPRIRVVEEAYWAIVDLFIIYMVYP